MPTRFVEQPRRKRWGATTGWQSLRTWKGPSEDMATFQSTELPAGYVDLDIVEEQRGTDPANSTIELAWVTLIATYGFDTANPGSGEPGLVQRGWSLDTVRDEQTIFACPNALLLQSYEESWPAKIKAAVEAWWVANRKWVDSQIQKQKNTPGQPLLQTAVPPDISGYLPQPPASAPPEVVLLAGVLVNTLMREENPTWGETRPVLRKTEVVTLATALKATHANKGRVLTYNTLTSSEPTLPAAALIDAAGLSSLLWLKHAPQVREVGRGEYQIEQDYEGAAVWDVFRYGQPL